MAERLSAGSFSLSSMFHGCAVVSEVRLGAWRMAHGVEAALVVARLAVYVVHAVLAGVGTLHAGVCCGVLDLDLSL